MAGRHLYLAVLEQRAVVRGAAARGLASARAGVAAARRVLARLHVVADAAAAELVEGFVADNLPCSCLGRSILWDSVVVDVDRRG